MRYRVQAAAIFCVLFSIGCVSAPAQKYVVETLADQLHLNAFRYIENDTVAQQFFGVHGPISLRAFDYTGCFPLSLNDITGITEWVHTELGDSLNPLDREYLRCKKGRNPKLSGLSTREDSVFSLIFMQIDSTFLPGYYVVPASLYHFPQSDLQIPESEFSLLRESMGDEFPEDPGDQRVLIYTNFAQAEVLYVMIFDRQGNILKVYRNKTAGP